MKIGIRADGSSVKGMGHIMRCSAIGKELTSRGVEVIFITKEDKGSEQILKNNEFRYKSLKSLTLDEEIIEVINIVKEYHIDYMITDSYWLSEEYLLELRFNLDKLICIDDNNIYKYPSHMIINGNIYANDLNYRLVYDDTKLLLGSKYAILREEFTNKSDYKNIKQEVESILVTMGGADTNNFTPIVIDAIKDLGIKLNILVGASFKNTNQLKSIQKNQPEINFIYNAKNLKDIMLNSDIAISAGGTTSYELASLGIPTILIQQVQNQANICSKMSEIEAMIWLGEFSEITTKTIKDEVIDLINNYDLRVKMNQVCRESTYKEGVKNIVDEILNKL